jgi:hypothetical protein
MTKQNITDTAQPYKLVFPRISLHVTYAISNNDSKGCCTNEIRTAFIDSLSTRMLIHHKMCRDLTTVSSQQIICYNRTLKEYGKVISFNSFLRNVIQLPSLMINSVYRRYYWKYQCGFWKFCIRDSNQLLRSTSTTYCKKARNSWDSTRTVNRPRQISVPLLN